MHTSPGGMLRARQNNFTDHRWSSVTSGDGEAEKRRKGGFQALQVLLDPVLMNLH